MTETTHLTVRAHDTNPAGLAEALRLIADQLEDDYIEGHDGSPTGERAYAYTTRNERPAVEVLAYRDPDGGTDLTAWINGERARIVEHVVDPGYGATLSDWRDTTARIEADTDLSPAFRAAVAESRRNAEDSSYITRD